MVQDVFLYCVTSFTFAVLFGLCYIRYVYTFFERRRIPHVSTPSFPFGNVADVIFRSTPVSFKLWKYYIRFKMRKCKFGGFYVFLRPAIVAIDSELVETVLSNDTHFESLDYLGHFEHDKSVDAKLGDLADVFLEPWSKIAERTNGGEVDVSKLVFEYVVEVSARKILDVNKLDDEFVYWLEGLLGRRNGVFSNFNELISICFPKSSRKSKCVRHCSDIIDNTARHRKKNDVKKDDVIQFFTDNDFATDRMAELVLGILGNLEVSSNLLLFCLHELSLNREIQDDLRREILEFKRSKDRVTLERLDELEYLKTVVYETLRKYPSKPLICRTCKKSYVKDGVDIPEGAPVFVSIFGIHHDPQYYPNPEEFDPDRFLEENEKFIPKKKYMPFDYRIGSGHHYMELVLKFGLVELLSRFKFSLGRQSKRSLEFDESWHGLRSKNGLWLNLETL